jgi:predicted metal-binding membrane protein
VGLTGVADGVTAVAGSTRDRTRVMVLGLLMALAAVAWAATAVRMARMESGPGMYPEELDFYVSAWVVMMAAMMLPSVWPAVGLYAGMQRGRRRREWRSTGAIVAFVGGYLLTWTAAGLAAFILLGAARSLGLDGLA